MPLTHLIFDLDDTLYPSGNGLWDDIGNRINQFLIDPIGVESERVNEVRGQYYQKYGTTLRGLMTDYPSINPADYLAYVHDIDLSKYIAPNPALNALLDSLPQAKVIFTNSDIPHANRVLTCLGIQSHFETIVDIRAMNFLNKPDPKAYEALFNAINVPATQCLFIEDSLRNLRPAKALGMTTVLVGNGHELDEAVDYQAKTILEVGSIIHNLIQGYSLMSIEEENLDVLQNIEATIITIYRANRHMTDYDVRSAIEALQRVYNAESRGKSAPTIALIGLAGEIFESVNGICNWRLGRSKIEGLEDTEIKSLDEIIACLKRIRKSIDMWNKEFGRQGYLDYIKKFL